MCRNYTIEELQCILKVANLEDYFAVVDLYFCSQTTEDNSCRIAQEANKNESREEFFT